jgi:hypothetical protein
MLDCWAAQRPSYLFTSTTNLKLLKVPIPKCSWLTTNVSIKRRRALIQWSHNEKVQQTNVDVKGTTSCEAWGGTAPPTGLVCSGGRHSQSSSTILESLARDQRREFERGLRGELRKRFLVECRFGDGDGRYPGELGRPPRLRIFDEADARGLAERCEDRNFCDARFWGFPGDGED